MRTDFVVKNNSFEELADTARSIVQQFAGEKLFLLYGRMGAGKTTLIKELCKALQVIDVVNSPTFSIVNEYKTVSGESVFHFDLYRIKSPVELLDIGYEEYLFSDSICLIEWPELATDLMPESYISIFIEVDEQTASRTLRVTKAGTN